MSRHLAIALLLLVSATAVHAQNMLNPCSYGKIFEENESGSAITITTAGTYYPWVSAEAGAGTGSIGAPYMTYSVGDPSRLIIGASGAGTYLIAWDAGISIDGGAIVHGAIHKNGSRVLPTTNHVESDAAGRLDMAMSGVTIIQLVADDYLDLRFTSDSNADEVDIFHCSLTAVKICP